MSSRSSAVEFPNPAGQRLSGRLERPPGTPRAVALFAHCFTCGKDGAAASRIARALSARGFAVLRFDFTGLGNSQGDFANSHFTANVQDLVAAADWLRSGLGAPSLLVGHSLGGAAVLAAAGRIEGVKAVVSIGAPSEPEHVQRLLRDDVGTIRAQGRAEVEIAGRTFSISREFLDDLAETRLLPSLGKLAAAALLLHSPQDEVVGIDHARRLYEALRHPKSFVGLEGANHLLTRKEDAAWVADLIAAWAARFLPPVQRAADAPTEGDVLVEGTGDGFLQQVTAGSHVWLADEPLAAGGQDAGPTPYDQLLAALGTCTSMTLGMYARHKQLSVGRIAVRLRHDRVHAKDCDECEADGGRVDRIQRWLQVEGDLSDEQRQRLLQIADRCPVHKTLMNDKQIETRWEE